MSEKDAKSDATHDLAIDKNNCKVCNLPISKRATKCPECSSFQNWRRYLNTSESFLALLVALASVLAFAIPVFSEAIKPNKSVLRLSKPLVESAYLELVEERKQENVSPKDKVVVVIRIPIQVSNGGKRPGHIASLRMPKMTVHINSDEEYWFWETKLDEPLSVPPEDGVVLELPIYGYINRGLLEQSSQVSHPEGTWLASFEMVVDAVDYDGTISHRQVQATVDIGLLVSKFSLVNIPRLSDSQISDYLNKVDPSIEFDLSEFADSVDQKEEPPAE